MQLVTGSLLCLKWVHFFIVALGTAFVEPNLAKRDAYCSLTTFDESWWMAFHLVQPSTDLSPRRKDMIYLKSSFSFTDYVWVLMLPSVSRDRSSLEEPSLSISRVVITRIWCCMAFYTRPLMLIVAGAERRVLGCGNSSLSHDAPSPFEKSIKASGRTSF